jgi:hypothetical protein
VQGGEALVLAGAERLLKRVLDNANGSE